jgi:hypothetical protein
MPDSLDEIEIVSNQQWEDQLHKEREEVHWQGYEEHSHKVY